MLAVLALLAAGAAQAFTPSYLCTKAKSWVEKTVCASERLSNLDLQLAVARSRMLKGLRPEGVRTLESEQRQWWASLTECRTASDPAACLAGRYEHRIAAIASRPDLPAAPTASREDDAIAPIATAGHGWTRDLSRYRRALRACREEAPKPVGKLLVAWPAGDGESVGLHLMDWNMKEYVCVAHLEGHKVFRFEERGPGETLPPPGPVYHIGGVSPPARCKNATQVLDVNGKSVGWISDADC